MASQQQQQQQPHPAYHSKDTTDAAAAKRGRLSAPSNHSSSSSSTSSTTKPTTTHSSGANGVGDDVDPVTEGSSSISASSSSSHQDASSESPSKDHPSSEKDVKPTECDLKPSLDIRGFNDDETANNDESTNDDTGGGGGGGSGDSDIEELTFDEESLMAGVEMDNIEGVTMTQHHRLQNESSYLDSSEPSSSSSSSSQQQQRQQQQQIIDTSNFNADFDIIAFMQANPKATALRAEFDMTVLDKSSVTHKLLTSLLYDISKASAANAPVKDKRSEVSRAYFNYVFENVWESFPNFENLMTMGAKVKDGGKHKNIKYFMRHKMQKWYGAMMDKMLGAEQNTSYGTVAALQWV